MKPMLAATIEDTTTLNFPLLASPKLDGIRALVIDGKLVSRNLKPIPNAHVQALFGRPELNGLDGELICGDPTDKAAFRNTTSAVMSKDGTPDVRFWVFDRFSGDSHHPFTVRFEAATNTLWRSHNLACTMVPHEAIRNLQSLEQYEATTLAQGYEGVMLRSADAPYKFGRSTMREHGLMKLKRFADAEAVVIGFEEQMHNTNEAKVDALGHTERSSHKAGMVGKGTLGALVVRGIDGQYKDVEFSIGSGMDDAIRSEIWADRISTYGTVVKYKYFPIGCKDSPRFPVFLGFRLD
jgi:DNA ligase 1